MDDEKDTSSPAAADPLLLSTNKNVSNLSSSSRFLVSAFSVQDGKSQGVAVLTAEEMDASYAAGR